MASNTGISATSFTIHKSEIDDMIRVNELLDWCLDVIDEVVDDVYINLTARPPRGTPVLSGQARLSWMVDRTSRTSQQISTTIPYMNKLNDGSSSQSPAGFVERAIDDVAD